MRVNGYEIHQGADLQGATLQGDDLREADLCRADLWRANLQGATLWRADLWRAKGIVLLNVCDPRGHVPIIQCKNGTLRIVSGCRDFSIKEARDHWGSPDYNGDKHIAQRYLCGIEWAMKSPEVMALIEDEKNNG